MSNSSLIKTRAILAKLDCAITSAKDALTGVTDSVDAKDLGSLYVGLSNKPDGVYISTLSGRIEVNGAFRLSWSDLAEELASNAVDQDELIQITAGLRKAAKIIKRNYLS